MQKEWHIDIYSEYIQVEGTKVGVLKTTHIAEPGFLGLASETGAFKELRITHQQT
jgi:hypothetical protein